VAEYQIINGIPPFSFFSEEGLYRGFVDTRWFRGRFTKVRMEKRGKTTRLSPPFGTSATFGFSGAADRFEGTRLRLDPIHELRHVGMSLQQVQGVILPLQSFLGEERVDVIVAGAANPRHALLYFYPVELTLVPFIGVAGLRDQMVLGQHALRPAAQFANSDTSHEGGYVGGIANTTQIPKNFYPSLTISGQLFRVPGVSPSGICLCNQPNRL
jgi:hypothetical protein